MKGFWKRVEMGLLAIAMLLCAACAAPEQEPEQEMQTRRLAHVWAGERRGDHHARGGADKRACLRI